MRTGNVITSAPGGLISDSTHAELHQAYGRRGANRLAPPAVAARLGGPEPDPGRRGDSRLGRLVCDLARVLGCELVLVCEADRHGRPRVIWAGGLDGDITQTLATRLGGRDASGRRGGEGSGGGFVGRALGYGRPAFETLDPDRDRALIDAAGGGLRHALSVPVPALGGDDGRLLVAGFSTAPREPEQAFWIVDTYARLASLMDHAGALDGLWERPRRDGLTGCLTYESTVEELSREINRSARADLLLSCCFIDLDGFKRVNDLHGHLVGNQVLAAVGLALRTAVRSCDTVGRYGGDEFIAILPQTSQTEAAAIAPRLRSLIVNRHAERLEGPLTASIGVAEWMPGASGEQLLAWADSALFAAKTLPGGVATYPHPASVVASDG